MHWDIVGNLVFLIFIAMIQDILHLIQHTVQHSMLLTVYTVYTTNILYTVHVTSESQTVLPTTTVPVHIVVFHSWTVMNSCSETM